ncbi:TPA: DUF5064 family protein [Pseudomonas putida]|uniref:DUF5064 domain-containing protein n=1 Tax=Pseudomonas putida (strain GB-1) TaxID=76869 RepID=B0KQL9_PSEPG|nr:MULTISPECIES: DUF5064 family protein [Pseudomonas]ABY96907.1 conserved hypothetical protein [Pseudomonas putida GB-1]APE97474.1 DUF5064 domain-containing protein [Pseudomonas putida]MBP0706652.1 DUF5064 family protein [Pseudomonas sp. T34]MCE1000777.1 DUF5064 family protein [Pseudomonas sp. NMI1173_11]MCK2186089.1 DUF5064 family protein [Pseudomonas sp. MB04B]
MAQYHPGHVHIERTALNNADHSYDLNIEYEAVSDPREGRGIQFHMHGSIEGKPVEEKFFLPKDQVLPSFLMLLTRKAQSYLAPPKKFETLSSPHKLYDYMFADIREKLDVKSGDPIKPEHLE